MGRDESVRIGRTIRIHLRVQGKLIEIMFINFSKWIYKHLNPYLNN
jgi:hypothetical protein